MGPGMGDSSREAKEVLVLMAVGMREHWKVPISFHLTRGANADQQKVLIMAAIEELQEQNVEVKVVTFDGAATNVSTAQKLGCSYEKDIYYFQYRDREIYVKLDAFHMLKVLRYEVYYSLSKSASNHLTLHLTMFQWAFSEPKLYLPNFVI